MMSQYCFWCVCVTQWIQFTFYILCHYVWLTFFAQELQYDDNGSLDSNSLAKIFWPKSVISSPPHPPNPDISYFFSDFPKIFSQIHKYLGVSTDWRIGTLLLYFTIAIVYWMSFQNLRTLMSAFNCYICWCSYCAVLYET